MFIQAPAADLPTLESEKGGGFVRRALSILHPTIHTGPLKPNGNAKGNSALKKRVMLSNYFTEELEKTRNLTAVLEDDIQR